MRKITYAPLPPLTECPYCELPIPVDSTELPYCNRKCFDAHINGALLEHAKLDDKVTRVVSKIHKYGTHAVSNHAGPHKVHGTYCACHIC